MANKLISQLLASASNLQDVDLAEIQLNGEVFSRKFTGSQLRAVEKLDRENADDLIEASVGLNTNGTFTPVSQTDDTYYLKAADYAAGCTNAGGPTGVLAQNILNGLILLDARIMAMTGTNYIVSHLNVNADTTYAALVPAGYMLLYVIFNEKAGSTATLDLGLAAGGGEVFMNQDITLSTLTTVVVNRIFSLGSDTDIYLNDDNAPSDWNGAIVDIYFVMTQIV